MPKIQEILLVPHPHHDIGYTYMPQSCLAAHERAIYYKLLKAHQLTAFNLQL